MSCEKELKIPIVSNDARLVVEGQISSDSFPTVMITKSLGFFDIIDFTKLDYIHNAQVEVKDLTANISIPLIEYNFSFSQGNNSFNFYIYAPDTNHPNILHFITGKFEHSYQLQIKHDNHTYTSYTKIPQNPGLDSLWFEPADYRPDSFDVLRCTYADPDTIGNSIRYKTLRKSIVKSENEIFYKSFSPNFDDEIVNGTTFPFTLDIGFNQAGNEDIDFRTSSLAKKGDTITVRWSAIDKPSYYFWNTFEFAVGSVGNPFASPTKVQSNIYDENNVQLLGVWAGYGNYYYTIIDSL